MRAERSGSLSSINSQGSSNKDSKDCLSPTAATPGCEKAELKSILRRRTMPAAIPCTRRALLQSQSVPTSPPKNASKGFIRSSSGAATPIITTGVPDVFPLSPARAAQQQQQCGTPPSPISLGSSPPLTSRYEQSDSGTLDSERDREKDRDKDRDRDRERDRDAEDGRLSDSSVRPATAPHERNGTGSSPDGTTPLTLLNISDEETEDFYVSRFLEDEKKARLKLVVLTGEEMPVSLDQFAMMFIDEEAQYNMKR